MRRLLVLLSVVAAVVSSGALVASAGLPEQGAPPATFGYTVLFFTSETPPTSLAEQSADTTGDAALTPQDVGGFDTSVLDLSDGVQPLQGSGCELSTVDFATGVITPIASTASLSACAGDLTFAPDGTLYGLVQDPIATPPNTHLVRFDLTTGEPTDLGQITAFNSFAGFNEVPFGGLTYDASGQLFALMGNVFEENGGDPACGESNFCLYRIDDPTDPEAATFVGGTSTETVLATLAASCSTVYVSELFGGDDESRVSTVDTATAALTDIGALDEEHFLYGADFDRSGTFHALVLAATQDGGFFAATLDPAGGTPIDTLGAVLEAPEGAVFLNALTVEPLDCTPEAAPMVLAPTFTG